MEAAQRENFLKGFLNQDLQEISKWHGTRPHHEQKRFLQSVDQLYKAFQVAEAGPRKLTKAEAQARAQAKIEEDARRAQERAIAMARAAEEDPLNGPPRTPRGVPAGPGMGSSASAPNMPSNPIEVFEQQKRETMRRKQGGEDALNSLDKWMEAQSMCTSATGTTATSRYTSLSQMTATSSGGSRSICSEPGTTNQATYRVHRRAQKVNSMNFAYNDPSTAGNLKDGIPGRGFPEDERMHTSFRDCFGTMPKGCHINRNMYASVFRDEAHPVLEKFIQNSSQPQKDGLAGMIRSLEYLRRREPREQNPMMREDMNIQENRRLWEPPAARPIRDPSMANYSQVPMGTTGASALSKLKATDKPPTPMPAPPPRNVPPSPSVSNLGSVPLSRLSTPMVGGKDLPFANAPDF